jgi:hypothetical protein
MNKQVKKRKQTNQKEVWGPFPLSCGVFLPLPLLQAFPFLVAVCVCVCHCLCLLQPACLFTVPWEIAPPLPSVLRAPHPLCYMSFFLVAYSVFFFFPWVGVSLSKGYIDLAQGCLWEYCMPLSSPGGLHLPKMSVWELTSGGMGALLVSPFDVKWECYVWAGCVEESKFCLFSVVFLVRCISSISPRFYFRKHTFCFLPLVTILLFCISVSLYCLRFSISWVTSSLILPIFVLNTFISVYGGLSFSSVFI